MSIFINLCLAIFVLVALLLVLVILMQRPKSEGLGAAFGAGVTENIFGAQTTNVLTKITAWLAGIFFTLTFALSILYAHKSVGESSLRRELLKTQAATNGSPAPGAQTSPGTSPAPDSGAGVLPAGNASPVTSPASPVTAPSAAASVAPTVKQPAAPAASPSTPKRKPTP
ncbi:MAG: preprotein translocase subunit SecG [Verrucomicrobiota bacterium]